MAVNKELIESVGKEIHDYEHTNFGVRFGQDFPQVAQALVSLEQFTLAEFMLLTMGLLSAKTTLDKLQGPIANESAIPLLAESMRGSPVESILLEVFYWGFRAGQRSSEVSELHKLHTPNKDTL